MIVSETKVNVTEASAVAEEKSTAPAAPVVDYNSKDHKRSRNSYLIECAFEYFVSLLVTDVFLVKLLKDIGMDDATVGIMASLISLAFVFQLFSIFVVQRITNVKVFAIVFHFASQMFFMALYFVPFLPAVEGSNYRHILAVACIMIAYFGNYLVTSIIYKWGNSFVDPHRRGRYCATKEMISLISGMVVTLIVGYAMDGFELADNLHGGFIFAACGIAIFSICDLVCLLMIKNEKRTKAQVKAEIVPLSEVFRNTLGNKKFLSVLLLAVLMEVGKGVSIGFLGTYRTNEHELALMVGEVMVINMIGNLVRFAVSRPFGKFSDKYSYAKGIELALAIVVCSFVVYACTVPSENRVLVWTMSILYSVLYHGAQAGLGQNMHSILYNYVDSKYFVQASAIKSSVGGLCYFGTALLAGRLLQYIQDSGNALFGISLYGQQVLAGISVLFMLGAMALTHFVVSKQKRMVQ